MIAVLPTSREPMRSFVDRIKALHGKDGILSISVIHGFMAADVPDDGDAGSSSSPTTTRPKATRSPNGSAVSFSPCARRP